mmetsp:Transcript_37977/g.46396  ORF Transcript_37977/g.46396 Transcript_37977/m.46396 type:complete len:206 (-) Transcript_37977:4401-5018(-)
MSTSERGVPATLAEDKATSGWAELDGVVSGTGVVGVVVDKDVGASLSSNKFFFASTSRDLEEVLFKELRRDGGSDIIGVSSISCPLGRSIHSSSRDESSSAADDLDFLNVLPASSGTILLFFRRRFRLAGVLTLPELVTASISIGMPFESLSLQPVSPRRERELISSSLSVTTPKISPTFFAPPKVAACFAMRSALSFSKRLCTS